MSTTTTTTLTASNGLSGKPAKLLSPEALCHLVLRSTPENYEPMIKFYQDFLGAEIIHRTPRLCFLAYDYEHHRVAIIADPTAKVKDPEAPTTGLHHVAFDYPTLADLATQYEQKKAVGIRPYWCVNHGMSTSMYWKDPDGNGLETQVDNFGTAKEAIAYMETPEFAENPIGVDYDPEEFVAKVRAGVSDKELKHRPNIGPRARP